MSDIAGASPAPSSAGPAGIGGWLILPAIGVVALPIRLLAGLKNYADAFAAVPADSLIHTLLIVDLGLTVALTAYGIYTAVQFFGKKRAAPRLFIGLLLAQLAFVLLDSLTALLFLGVPMFDPDTVRTLLVLLIACAIWTTYFRRSVRVRNTFIN
jgi:hypothetical protein